MADNAAIAAALANLAAAINNMNNNAAPQQPPRAPHVVILDPFESDEPFDLSARVGSTAFANACAALDDPWNGNVDTFPAFIISLRIRSGEVHWDAPAPRGILTIDGHNLLTEYHSITDTEITAARTARVDPRSIQNSRAMYKYLKSSITGDLRATVFDQAGNVPIYEDGPTLFKKLTDFTMVASLQLSMLSFKMILEFDPAVHTFHIPTVNTKLKHLFVLATTRERELLASERIQHTLTVYARIQQPEPWAQWVRNQVDRFEDGQITNCQDFMNSAIIKYNKIAGTTEGGFNGASTTLQQDIAAMMTAVKRKHVPAPSAGRSSNPLKHDADQTANPNKRKTPPFVKHFKSSTSSDAPNYKVGDSKNWDNTTWYFCDCPNHRDKIKWHTHAADTCRTRLRWLEGKPAAVANQGEVQTNDASPAMTDNDSTATDISGLLASAMSLAGDNPVAMELIADALNAIHDA
jgi:hypothetical protein